MSKIPDKDTITNNQITMTKLKDNNQIFDSADPDLLGRLLPLSKIFQKMAVTPENEMHNILGQVYVQKKLYCSPRRRGVQLLYYLWT
jgi:hypothetical protein